MRKSAKATGHGEHTEQRWLRRSRVKWRSVTTKAVKSGQEEKKYA